MAQFPLAPYCPYPQEWRGETVTHLFAEPFVGFHPRPDHSLEQA